MSTEDQVLQDTEVGPSTSSDVFEKKLEDAGDVTSSPHEKELSRWSVTDVTEWLEKKNLHKFITLFQKHEVTGEDLLNLELPFLEDYEHISLEDRETLLAEVYLLLNPATVSASQEDLTKIKSPIEKKKYMAAIEVAQVKSATLPRSSSVLVLPTHSASVKLSSRRSPIMKPRHRSESGTEGQVKLSTFLPNVPDHKKRKTMPKMKEGEVLPVYRYIQTYGPRSVCCMELSPQQQMEISMETDKEGRVNIETVPEGLGDKLFVGDRVLEINGYIVRPHLKDAKSHLASMLKCKTPAILVVLTKHPPKTDSACLDEKWDTLHSMLVDMRDDDSFLDQSTSLPSISQDSEFSHVALLQEEIRKLEEKNQEQQKMQEQLQLELESKDALLHDLELSRDKAIEKLKESRSRVRNKNSKETVGGREYYNMTMNSLNLETASKEEVVTSLQEIVTEASKQKWYLDRLISLVIEESPWLLDEVDTEFDHLTVTSESEEFC